MKGTASPSRSQGDASSRRSCIQRERKKRETISGGAGYQWSGFSTVGHVGNDPRHKPGCFGALRLASSVLSKSCAGVGLKLPFDYLDFRVQTCPQFLLQ